MSVVSKSVTGLKVVGKRHDGIIDRVQTVCEQL